MKTSSLPSNLYLDATAAGAAIVVVASVNIFQMAGRLKDISYKKNRSKNRKLSTGDAVMLATALYIQDQDAYGYP